MHVIYVIIALAINGFYVIAYILKGEKEKMTISLKRTLSVILCLIMAFSAAAFSFEGKAESKVLIADAGDDDFTWRLLHGNGELSVDKQNKIQGNGSIFIDMAPDGQSFIADVFAMQTLLEFENPVNINQWDYFEFCLYTEGEFKFDPVIQYNLIDGDYAGYDGYNCGKWLFDRIYVDPDDPDNYNDIFKEDGWMRIRNTIAEVLTAKPEAVTVSPDNICKIRFSWLYYSNKVFDEVDWGFDGVIFFNQEFLDARSAAEESMKAKIEAIPVLTDDNYEENKEAVAALVAEYTSLSEQYANFMPENFEKYFTARDFYKNKQMAEDVAAIKAKLEKFSDPKTAITIENYRSLQGELESIDADFLRLDNLYGEGNYGIDKKQIMTTLWNRYHDCESMDKINELLETLPEPENITLDNKETYEEIARLREDLNDKTIMPNETAERIEKTGEKIYDLEHPYILGDVSGDKRITAEDALITLQHAVGKLTLTGNQLLAANVDGNEKVDATDALLILQRTVIKIDKFPIED